MRAVGSLPVMFTLLNELYPTEIRTQSIAINDTIGQWFLTFYCKISALSAFAINTASNWY